MKRPKRARRRIPLEWYLEPLTEIHDTLVQVYGYLKWCQPNVINAARNLRPLIAEARAQCGRRRRRNRS